MLFRRELKSNARGLVIWSLVLGGLVLMMMSVYPSFAEDAQTVEEVLNVFPEPIADVFGKRALAVVLFTAAREVATHDLGVWSAHVAGRGFSLDAPRVRHVDIGDRYGNAVCTVGVFGLAGRA